MEQQMLTALVAQDPGAGTPPAESGGSGQQGPAGCGQMGGMLIPILLMFVIIYFLIMRPQQKQQKKLREMLQALKKGDRIITNAGIFGTIVSMNNAVATLEIAKNTHIRVLRGQIAGLQPEQLDEKEVQPVVPEENK